MVNNPFILYGYESEEYFCDRKEETSQLLQYIENGNNVALIAPRRIGKTGLIENLFHQTKVRKGYENLFVPYLLLTLKRLRIGSTAYV